MILGVLSDTHGHLANTRRAADVLRKRNVEAVLHCGDVGDVAVAEILGEWPTHYVLGNNDRDPEWFREAIESNGGTFHERYGEFELVGLRIALLHGDILSDYRQAITAGCDLVCLGHSHVASQRRDGSSLVLNPGALFRANPHTVAIVETQPLSAEIVELRQA